MPDLLLELGCEELPAYCVRRAYGDLEAAIIARLKEVGLTYGASCSMGTPRRLIVQVQNIPERQPDMQKEQRGPGLTSAYDASGGPTKALEGFCRSQGISTKDLRKEGEYVWASKTIPGKPTLEVLESLLPEAIRSLSFDKSMRWGNLRMRFARPIRWILAAFGGQLAAFDIDGIRSGLESRGHRFNHPENFEATAFDQLVSGLRRRQVEPNPAERELRIRSEAENVASGKPDMPDALVDENVFLTEWPTAIACSFREEFLELPEPVLVIAMAKHERFFPIRNEQGKVTNRFVSIRNGGIDDVVRDGNAWVLNARFNDAKFFFDEDRKYTLQDFLEKTKGIVFQDKLGTVHQRAYRLAELTSEVARATGADAEEQDFAEKAGLFAKADLSSGLVSELPALQGLIGAEYARREGMTEAICDGIATHYDLSRNAAADSAGIRTSARLAIADQLDKLAGYLGIGQLPSGSSDPYGLRRAATVLIEAALSWAGRFQGYRELFDRAQDCYREQGFEVVAALPQLAEIFRSRYDAIFAASRYDIVEAALLADYAGHYESLDPQRVRDRIAIMERLASDLGFVQAATRPLNIVSAAVKNGVPFDYEAPFGHLAKLDSAAGEELAVAAQKAESRVRKLTPGAYDQIASELKSLESPINSFFDSTMVMVDLEDVRFARLSLLHGVNLLLRHAGDFAKIVISG